MFCNQCEQTAKGTGCGIAGVCGKQADAAELQDLLLYSLQGLSVYAYEAGKQGIRDREIDEFTVEALFATVTNVNFDVDRLAGLIRKSFLLREKVTKGVDPAAWVPAVDLPGLIAQGHEHGIDTFHTDDEDIRSVMQILVYGLKGMAAYLYHAALLGETDDEVMQFTHKALASLSDDTLSLGDYIGLAMECGQANFKAMEMLDRAHTGRFGHPVPTSVNLGTRRGKAVLISGHDLLDLEALLQQTEGKGINVYTHGEMLPAHGYPELKKYSHLAGNYGSAWQNQAKEFAAFPGAILMTTNCIQRPSDGYKENIFTCGPVAWPGVRHIGGRDFSAVIERALELPGFEDNPGQEITVGFGHNTVLGVADKVIEAVKEGHIRHFFLVGGCDGAKPGRNYYTEFVEKAPGDTIILTLACGKYRFNRLELGDIGGIPRLLDIGQCNDAYSAVKIASALAEAFDCGINDLPLSLIISWYEQKAVAILLTLLALGVKNIKLGPSLPAFVSPNVLAYLVENFNISPITTAEEDLKAILG
ncbi:MAG: hydroxylamine reductase [bacterium]|nr:hydroxylamine reductase [bacterium]